MILFSLLSWRNLLCCYFCNSLILWIQEIYTWTEGKVSGDPEFKFVISNFIPELHPWYTMDETRVCSWFFVFFLHEILAYDAVSSLPAIAGFGTNGQLVGKEENLDFKTKGSPSYPFVKPYICEEEILQRLIRTDKWDSTAAFLGIPAICTFSLRIV